MAKKQYFFAQNSIFGPKRKAPAASRQPRKMLFLDYKMQFLGQNVIFGKHLKKNACGTRPAGGKLFFTKNPGTEQPQDRHFWLKKKRLRQASNRGKWENVKVGLKRAAVGA